MFCLSTIHLSIGLTKLIQGFQLAGIAPPGTLAVFIGKYSWINAVEAAVARLRR